jgi:predicted phage terminase large subunit-like protein
MFTAGVGGPLTGRGADCLVIDDPIKNAAEARSAVVRASHWDWWETTASTRLEPGAFAMLVMTRWHQRDLAGMLLENEPGQWEEIRLPAIAEEDDWLGRAPGEPLWPERWSLERLLQVRENRSASVWASIYQQRPAPEGGNVWKRETFRYADVAEGYIVLGDGRRFELRRCFIFLTIDLAASLKTSSDYTAIACWAITGHGDLVLLDLDHRRMEGPDHEPSIRAMMTRWNGRIAYVESATFGLTLIQQARRSGLPVRELEADTDKVSRAMASTPAFAASRVWFCKVPKLAALEDELLSFPNAAHDDIADVVAYAVRVLQQHRSLSAGLPDLGDGGGRYDASVTSRGSW